MYQVMPTLNNKFPCEGPRVVPCVLDFTSANTFDIDLKSLVQGGKISEVQSVFVDNSDNSESLVIAVSVQNQRIIIPPRSQAYLGMLASVAQFTVTSAGSLAVVTLFAQNFPVANCVWAASSTGANPVTVTNFPPVQPVFVSTGSSFAFTPDTTGANLSVTTTSASVAIAPLDGQNIRLFNSGNETVFVRLTDTTTTATVDDLAIAPNSAVILNATGMTILSAICMTNTTTLNYVIGNGGI